MVGRLSGQFTNEYSVSIHMSQHQSVLCQPAAAHDAAGARDRGGDISWKSDCWIDEGNCDAAVSIGMEIPTHSVRALTLL